MAPISKKIHRIKVQLKKVQKFSKNSKVKSVERRLLKKIIELESLRGGFRVQAPEEPPAAPP